MREVLNIFTSEYSLGRSILTCSKYQEIKDSGPASIFTIAKDNNLSEVFIADSSFSGLIECFESSKDCKIPFRFGYKVILCADINDKSPESKAMEHKVTIWLKNTKAYQTCIKIATKAATEGFYWYPRIDYKNLQELFDENLLLTSSFYDGLICNNILKLGRIVPDFGKIKPIFFIERLHELPFDNLLESNVQNYCDTANYECLESHIVFYSKEEDFLAYNVRRCIDERSDLQCPNLDHFSSNKFAFETLLNQKDIKIGIDEFSTQFEEYKFNFYGVRLPQIQVSKEDKISVEADKDCDNFTYLTQLCYKGFERKLKAGKINPSDAQKYADRCKYELDVFKKHNLTDYILLVYDILNWCDKQDIPRGVARGSASGCCVFYLIGCNKIDPILHSLPFTRFISEARLQSKVVDGVTYLVGKTLPDYDSDVSYLRRQEVIAYIDERFKGKTSKIITFSALSGKILIKECCKAVLNYSESEAQEASNKIERHFGNVEKLKDAYQNNEEFKKWADSSEEIKRCFDIACKLELLYKNRGQHPSGIAISFDDIRDTVPLETVTKEIVCSFDMQNVANLLVKFDALGLRNVDVNHETCKLLGISVDSIDINHPSIYQYLQNNDRFKGLFQIESGLTKKTVVQVKPKNIDELACCVSLSRPGTYKDIPKYAKYINEGILESIYPSIDKTLALTGNVLLYQEQVTQLLVEVYGFTEIDADQVRYITGKKLRNEIGKWEPIIHAKGKEKNVPKEVTDKIWETIKNSADYQFSKNHAYSYSYTTAINTFLKVNHPKEFYLSLLKLTKAEPNPLEEINIIEKELKERGIKLCAPHIFKSKLDFSIDGEQIIMGLGNIKGVAGRAIEKLEKFRHPFANKFDIFQSAEEAKIPINILSVLVGVGAMDGLYKQSRAWMVLEIALWSKLTTKEKIWAQKLGEENDWDLLKIVPKLKDLKDDKGKVIIKESRFETIKKAYAPYKEIYKQNSAHEDFTFWNYSSLYLGFSHGKTLKDIFIEKRPGLINLAELKDKFNEDKVAFIGQVIDIMKGTSKKGNKYVKFLVADETSQFGAWIFKDAIEQCEELNGGRLPKEGDFVIVRGTKKGKDSVFAEVVAIQKNNVIMRPSQVKSTEEDADFAPVSNIIFTRKLEEDEEIA